jgi:signal transduction histidine kinase
MTLRLPSVVYLIACSLLGIFLLQAYFGYQVYQQHTAALEREAYRALSEAILTANEHRITRINELFARDIRNPALVELQLNLEEEEPRIFIKEPETGNVHTSIRFRSAVDSVTAVRQMEEDLINYNRTFLEEESVMYWTDNIGKRIARYADSIQISQEFLAKEIEQELDTLNISSDFELLLSNDSISPSSSFVFKTGPRKVPAKIDGHTSVAIVLSSPNREVLKRTGFVFVMTLMVLLLMVGSFMVLLRLIRRQKKLSQLKDDFIDNVTHELLTPITTLKLALESLRNNDSKRKPSKYLEMSEQQTQRIAEVVDHILQVSFVDEQHPGLNMEEVNVTNLLREVLEYHQATADKPLEIITSLGLDRIVLSDQKHLQNVFHNLIGNAIKYAPDSGVSLSINISEVSDELHIAISDNGPGIPPSERDKIFDKFHRVTNLTTHEVKGLGIGLYYARGILRQLQGDLLLTKSTLTGATFSVILPLQTPIV